MLKIGKYVKWTRKSDRQPDLSSVTDPRHVAADPDPKM